MTRNFLFIGLGVLLGLGFISGAFFLRPYQFKGSEINPPVPAGDFSLSGGQIAVGDFRLNDQQGKVVVILPSDIPPARTYARPR